MPKAIDRTESILPRINEALAADGCGACEVVYGDDGARCLQLPGVRYEIRQVGVVTGAMLPQLLRGMTPGGCILWAQYIPESVAVVLTRRGFCYADTAGNMLLRFGGNFLQIRNCPRPREAREELVCGRSFTPAGLQVLFLFLTEPSSVGWSYREIAAQSGTTAATVSYVVADLKARHFLVEQKGARRLVERSRLCRLWVENYRLRLLPRVKRTRYAGELGKLPEDYALVGGGETVAAREKLLQTNSVLLWKQDGGFVRTVLGKHWRLDPEGNIEVRDAFWPTEHRHFQGRTPWLLVYADLLSTDDGRCLEAAEEIFQQHLEGEEA